MGSRIKKFSFMRVHWKIQFLGGVSCLKRGLGQFADLRGDLAKKRRQYFWGSVDNAMHTNTMILLEWYSSGK